MSTQHYESPSIGDAETELRALSLLRQLDGLPVVVARRVLRQAEFWLDATTTLDCNATEFVRAVEGWTRAGEQSL